MLLIRYVKNTRQSAEFYSELFNKPAVEYSENYSDIQFDDGLQLGLWSNSEVRPETNGTPGCSELCIVASNRDQVDEYYNRWHQQGIKILQSPTEMCFGYTFTAADPDGHRIRVCFPND